MYDIINAESFQLIIAFIAIIVLLLLCYLFSQSRSMKKEEYQSLVERTKQKRSDYYKANPDFWKKRQHDCVGIIKSDRSDGVKAAIRSSHEADSELSHSIEYNDSVSNQPDNVIVWDNLESIPIDSDSAEISVSDEYEEIRNNKYKYMQAAVEGRFLKLLTSEEKCFFRTWEEQGKRKYEFYGNVNKALANINAIFDDVCEIEGKQNGATNIENIAPGIIDENLKIVKKATIKLT